MLEKKRCQAVASPVLKDRLPAWRSRVVLGIIFFAFSMLLMRAAWVQLINADFYTAQGRKRVERVLTVPAARGDIVGRNGRLLALSQPMHAIYAVPSSFAAPLASETLVALSGLLSTTPERLERRLSSTRQMVYLKRGVSPALAEQIAALKIPGVGAFDEWQRYYPNGESSAQIVGFADIDEVGQEGVEASSDSILRPIAGRRTVVRNRLGEIVDDMPLDPPEPPQPGKMVQLTIDERIQHAAYQALKESVAKHEADAGAAVVLDAVNGEIIAMASWPSFDPNDRLARRGDAVRNRAVTDTFEPGSTIKPIHIAAALEAGRVTPQTTFVTAPGWLKLGRFTVRDTMPHDRLSVSDIVRFSSNVGMVRLTAGETRQEMWQSLRNVGFGKSPVVPLAGAASGTLRDVARWHGPDQAALSYGYGTSVSLLQLAHAYTIFGSSGRLLPLTLIKGEADSTPLAGEGLGVSSKTAREIRTMMESATASGGTAQRARIVGYRVAAKTGTTRKMEGKGYASREYYATTIGLAPAQAPRFVVAVFVDTPRGIVRGGGTVAAPLFGKIMHEALRLYGVPPDELAPLSAPLDRLPRTGVLPPRV